ncbi:MAG: cytochrome c biogenesis protein ResB [Desulfamplus sp.]|nr:cytochrome c biogenesis protein ResB [Desulfamplus sp.]
MTKKISKTRAGNPVWNFFTSVKLTVVVLLLLASTSVIGTLIPQNSSEAFYIQKYGEVFYNLFSSLDIFDMYGSWWFILLLVLLSINIVVCSMDKLTNTWKIIFPQKVNFNIERFRRLKIRECFDIKGDVNDALARCEGIVRGEWQTTVKEDAVLKEGAVSKENALSQDSTGKTLMGGGVIFAESGRWTRLGVYVVHVSVLLMLAGAVAGSVWGYKSFVAIPEGETVGGSYLRGTNEYIPFGFDLRCNSFSVTFYDTGHPEEFKSSLTVIKEGEDVLTSDIVVNDPLRYGGLSFYQSSYGTHSARNVALKITSSGSGMSYVKVVEFGQTIDMPESAGTFTLNEFVRGYNFRGHDLGEGFVGTFIPASPMGDRGDESMGIQRDESMGDKGDQNVVSPGVEVYMPLKFPSFDKMRRGEFIFEVDSYEKKYYTGLQVTKDPGVWYVYAGFVLMIMGCWITFFMSHRQICVEITPKPGGIGVTIYGTSTRNSQGMKLKVMRLAKKLKTP